MTVRFDLEKLIWPGIVPMPGFFFVVWFVNEIMFPIQVNGATQMVEPNSTVADLIERLKMNPKFLAVELNLKVVPRSEHGRTKLSANDNVEIVTLVGGG